MPNQPVWHCHFYFSYFFLFVRLFYCLQITCSQRVHGLVNKYSDSQVCSQRMANSFIQIVKVRSVLY